MVKPVSRTMAKATVGIGMKATNGLVDAKATVDGEGKGNQRSSVTRGCVPEGTQSVSVATAKAVAPGVSVMVASTRAPPAGGRPVRWVARIR